MVRRMVMRSKLPDGELGVVEELLRNWGRKFQDGVVQEGPDGCRQDDVRERPGGCKQDDCKIMRETAIRRGHDRTKAGRLCATQL
jgi:hypothetical protein